jgi:DNA polymerase-3 subunit epsilon
VQIAALIHEEGSEEVHAFMEYAQPIAPMHPKAQATHGISEEQLQDAPLSQLVVKSWWDEVHAFAAGAPIVFAGHNVHFDIGMVKRYLDDAEFPLIIDTLRIARANMVGSHKLDDLYPALGVDDPRADKAHDALADCWRCFYLLKHFCDTHGKGYEDLALHYAKPQRIKVMPFGKHKGLPLQSVDRSYLQWLYGKEDLNPDLAFSIKEILYAK